jgi:dTDP-4-amino-4,6-dideoxygalactose transaminase
MAITEDADLAHRMRMMSLHGLSQDAWDRYSGGRSWDYRIVAPGYKYNLTDVAAVIGLNQLPQLGAITMRRHALAKHYFATFGADFEKRTGVQLPVRDFDNTNWHMFQIVLPQNKVRAAFMGEMMARNIGCGVHYPPIHLFQMYRERGFKEGMFPVAESVGRRIVTLPLFPRMTEADVERVCAAVNESLAG